MARTCRAGISGASDVEVTGTRNSRATPRVNELRSREPARGEERNGRVLFLLEKARSRLYPLAKVVEFSSNDAASAPARLRSGFWDSADASRVEESDEGDAETRGDPSFSSSPHLLRLFSGGNDRIDASLRFPQRRELTSCESSAVLEERKTEKGPKGVVGDPADTRARETVAIAEELKRSDESALRESQH